MVRCATLCGVGAIGVVLAITFPLFQMYVYIIARVFLAAAADVLHSTF